LQDFARLVHVDSSERGETIPPKLIFGEPISIWLALAFDLLLLIATGTYVYYARKQTNAINGQLDVMNKSLSQTQQIIQQAKIQASAAVDNAVAAKTAAQAAKISADISQRQVRAYVNLRLTDRNSLTFDATTKSLKAVIDFVNAGQSPAENVVTVNLHYFTQHHTIIAENCKEARRLPRVESGASNSVMGPQGSIGIEIGLHDDDGTKLAGIKAGRDTVCVFGSVFYDDIFDIRHETEFCLYSLTNGNWLDCASHNGMYDYARSKNASASPRRRDAVSAVVQRAWLIAMPATIKQLEVGKPITVATTIVNSGRTVALETEIANSMRYGPQPITDFRYPPFKTKPSILSVPAESSYGIDLSSDRPAPAEEVTLLRSGVGFLYYWGTIKYKDIFNMRHKTDFCFFFRGTDGPIPCPEHNKTD